MNAPMPIAIPDVALNAVYARLEKNPALVNVRSWASISIRGAKFQHVAGPVQMSITMDVTFPEGVLQILETDTFPSHAAVDAMVLIRLTIKAAERVKARLLEVAHKYDVIEGEYDGDDT